MNNKQKKSLQGISDELKALLARLEQMKGAEKEVMDGMGLKNKYAAKPLQYRIAEDNVNMLGHAADDLGSALYSIWLVLDNGRAGKANRAPGISSRRGAA